MQATYIPPEHSRELTYKLRYSIVDITTWPIQVSMHYGNPIIRDAKTSLLEIVSDSDPKNAQTKNHASQLTNIMVNEIEKYGDELAQEYLKHTSQTTVTRPLNLNSLDNWLNLLKYANTRLHAIGYSRHLHVICPIELQDSAILPEYFSIENDTRYRYSNRVYCNFYFNSNIKDSILITRNTKNVKFRLEPHSHLYLPPTTYLHSYLLHLYTRSYKDTEIYDSILRINPE